MPAPQRTVLITGCTDGGIGAALAAEYHSRGLRVFATSRRVETMKGLEELGIETLALDITKLDSIRNARDVVSARTTGKLDILVNNAGKMHESSIIDADMTEVRELFELNLFGHISMVKEFMPLLMAGRNACIVNIGSGGGLLPIPMQAPYNATKAALHSFSDTLRIELEPFGIKVAVTGGVKSNILTPARFPESSLYKSMEEVANVRHVNIQKNSMPAEKYARQLVAETIRSSPPNYSWGGGQSGIVWFLTSFFPRWVPEKAIKDMYGFTKFSAQVRKEKLENLKHT
ncbi:short chain dehydrogenase reductase [Favolaschia claudopus]|uniref:Short chain dehydrogenase reductase n=1 Tax=Favolaschia claudopus TaxID=2862362 RepID=A0AAW0CHJ8_9AGAR